MIPHQIRTDKNSRGKRRKACFHSRFPLEFLPAGWPALIDRSCAATSSCVAAIYKGAVLNCYCMKKATKHENKEGLKMAKLNQGDVFPALPVNLLYGGEAVTTDLFTEPKTVIWALRYIGCTVCR